MALITQARLHIDAVNSSKIEDDTVIAADVDETVPYNFSSTSSTYDGIFKGIANSSATIQGIVSSSATIAGIIDPIGSTANFIQTGVGTVGAAEDSTVVFADEMSAIPKVFPVNTSTAVAILVKSASTAAFVVTVDTASTFNYLAIANSG